jgi:transcriptional regulator with XRE-family HTH domain
MPTIKNNKPVTEEARRFKEFRKAENLTQKQLGEILSKEQATIQRYEKGTFAIPIEVVKALHENYQMSLDWFFLGKGSRLYVPQKGSLVTDMKTFETNQSILTTQLAGLKQEFNKLFKDFYALKAQLQVQSSDNAGTKNI